VSVVKSNSVTTLDNRLAVLYYRKENNHMLNRKKTADELLNIIGLIENHLDLTETEVIKLTNEIFKLYQKIMKELYPNL
jgi:hypothetical protein